LTIWPRKCGPSARQVRRAASPWNSHAPLRVATSTSARRAGFVRAAARAVRFGFCADGFVVFRAIRLLRNFDRFVSASLQASPPASTCRGRFPRNSGLVPPKRRAPASTRLRSRAKGDSASIGLPHASLQIRPDPRLLPQIREKARILSARADRPARAFLVSAARHT